MILRLGYYIFKVTVPTLLINNIIINVLLINWPLASCQFVNVAPGQSKLSVPAQTQLAYILRLSTICSVPHVHTAALWTKPSVFSLLPRLLQSELRGSKRVQALTLQEVYICAA